MARWSEIQGNGVQCLTRLLHPETQSEMNEEGWEEEDVTNQVDNVIKRQALRIFWGCTYKQKCCSLTALNLAVISYCLHDSSYASSILLRMMDWIYNLFLSDHKIA